jgi:hypothetical protein
LARAARSLTPDSICAKESDWQSRSTGTTSHFGVPIATAISQ